MKLDEFVFLAGDTMRSKAYLQLLVKESLYPSLTIVFVDDKERLIEEKSIDSVKSEHEYFDEKESLLKTLENNRMDYIIVEERDINSDEMYHILQSTEQEYIIYSGYGGAILKERLFRFGKKFIHIHAGKLPEYRGSTTAYYSIIQENCISATAIFLNEKIDEGDIILHKEFTLPKKEVNIDYIYEPYTRAITLTEAIKGYYSNGKTFITHRQSPDEGETYYIIHPVLKHLALLSVSNNMK